MILESLQIQPFCSRVPRSNNHDSNRTIDTVLRKKYSGYLSFINTIRHPKKIRIRCIALSHLPGCGSIMYEVYKIYTIYYILIMINCWKVDSLETPVSFVIEDFCRIYRINNPENLHAVVLKEGLFIKNSIVHIKGGNRSSGLYIYIEINLYLKYFIFRKHLTCHSY